MDNLKNCLYLSYSIQQDMCGKVNNYHQKSGKVHQLRYLILYRCSMEWVYEKQ